MASLIFWSTLLSGGGLAVYVNIAGAIGLSAMTYWLPFVFTLTLRWGSLGYARRLGYIVGAAGARAVRASLVVGSCGSSRVQRRVQGGDSLTWFACLLVTAARTKSAMCLQRDVSCAMAWQAACSSPLPVSS